MMPRNSTGPTCAIACTPKLLAGIAPVMNREAGAWKVLLPASTRRRNSSSSPSYQTWTLLLASNSRWLSKSTSTCSRCPTIPAVRIAYCGLGVIVGNPALHPDSVSCSSCDVQRKLRNWSAFNSSRRFSCIPKSAYGAAGGWGRMVAVGGGCGGTAGGGPNNGGGRPRGSSGPRRPGGDGGGEPAPAPPPRPLGGVAPRRAG